MEIKNPIQINISKAVELLAALAQEHRLAIFRLLVKAGPKGLPAGQIAKVLNMPASTLSFHLTQLKQSGLIHDQRVSRSIIYQTNFTVMGQILTFLMDNCCEGDISLPEHLSIEHDNAEHPSTNPMEP